MIRRTDPDFYYPYFEVTGKTIAFMHHELSGRKFRKGFDEPGGHSPYAVEYSAKWDIDPKDNWEILLEEPYPVGTFHITWRDDAAQLVTQQMILYCKLVNVPMRGWKRTPGTRPYRRSFQFGCTNLRAIRGGMPCGMQVASLRLPYENKAAWGCTHCLPNKMREKIPLETYEEKDLQRWYDQLLGTQRPVDPWAYANNYGKEGRVDQNDS